jgi:hypothetical protein
VCAPTFVLYNAAAAAAPCVAAAECVLCASSAYAINSIEADVENEHYCITKRHNGFIILCECVCMFLLQLIFLAESVP